VVGNPGRLQRERLYASKRAVKMSPACARRCNGVRGARVCVRVHHVRGGVGSAGSGSAPEVVRCGCRGAAAAHVARGRVKRTPAATAHKVTTVKHVMRVLSVHAPTLIRGRCPQRKRERDANYLNSPSVQTFWSSRRRPRGLEAWRPVPIFAIRTVCAWLLQPQTDIVVHLLNARSVVAPPGGGNARDAVPQAVRSLPRC